MTFAECQAIAEDHSPDEALAIALALPDRAERNAMLYMLHPAECPDITEPLPYLIHPPSKLGATSRWLDFRDRTLIPMREMRPDDRFLAALAEQIERIIDWRDKVPTEARFWKADT